MTIDLPSCNLETCKFFFDCNCTNPKAYERCRYAHQFEWLINKKYEWISVKDRLPEPHMPVLVSDKQKKSVHQRIFVG